MPHDALRDEIERLAVGIAALRIVYGLIKRGNGMTIEIKGLGANVEAARAAIRRSRVAVANMNESGRILESTANEIATVFDQHTADLIREASNLGNGAQDEESESGVRSMPKPAPAQPSQATPTSEPAKAGAMIEDALLIDPATGRVALNIPAPGGGLPQGATFSPATPIAGSTDITGIIGASPTDKGAT